MVYGFTQDVQYTVLCHKSAWLYSHEYTHTTGARLGKKYDKHGHYHEQQ